MRNNEKFINCNDLPFTIFMNIVGIFWALFFIKQYELYESNLERARKYRDKLDELKMNGLIRKLETEADIEHNEKNPRLEELRLNYM